MPIKGLSDARRLPRLGKIHLGIKKTAGSGKEYPSEVDYFVCPPEVEKVFGEKPKALRVMFPLENEEVFFSQYYKCYGASLLKCKGDGEKATTWDEENGGMKDIACPCKRLESGECKQVGILQFLIPDVPGAGVYQITTSSKNSIIDINSSIAFIRSICGRVRMIPLILKREENVMQRTENGSPKKSTHYTLKIDLDENITLRQLQQAAQVSPETVLLPPPDESKDDLLYPANGFARDGDGAAVKALPQSAPDASVSEEENLLPLMSQLNDIIERLTAGGYKIGDKQTDYLNSLVTSDDYKKAIEFFTGKFAELRKAKRS